MVHGAILARAPSFSFDSAKLLRVTQKYISNILITYNIVDKMYVGTARTRKKAEGASTSIEAEDNQFVG